MVEHIVEQSKELMLGMKHEDDCFFYHSALSLMTANDTIDWMKNKGYYK